MKRSEFGPVAIGKLLNIGGMLERKANQLLLPFGLNQQQFSILFEIQKWGEVNQKTMVNRLVLEKAHVSKIMKKLCGMGLISRRVSPEDKRITLVSVTEKGKELVDECKGVIDDWNMDWTGRVGKKQRDVIIDNLSLLQDIFKEKLQEGGEGE